jgi:2-C-methyl-D-erythritol 4-phosphate cytidylyltransferase
MLTPPPFAAVLPAAGSGTRFGSGDKLLAPLGPCSALQRSVLLFVARPDIAQVVIVTAPERFDAYRQHLAAALSPDQLARLTFTPGGRERWESVLHGLRAVDAALAFVAVHDAARPLTPAAVIDAAFAGARAVGGSVPCIAEPATLKRRDAAGHVTATVSRAGLFQAQTPQCFGRAELLAAYETLRAAGRLADVTDDAQVFERIGRPVLITPGSPLNLKITTPEDAHLAQALVGMRADGKGECEVRSAEC